MRRGYSRYELVMISKVNDDMSKAYNLLHINLLSR